MVHTCILEAWRAWCMTVLTTAISDDGFKGGKLFFIILLYIL